MNTTGDTQIAISKNSWRFVKRPNIMEKIVLISKYLENIEGNFQASNMIKSIWKWHLNVDALAHKVTDIS